MYPDPNWLLSTIVQSAAAIIAIVAGFIISRLIALSAERGSLESRFHELELQIHIISRNIEPLKTQLLEWDAKEFLEDPDVIEEMIKTKGHIPLANIINQHGFCKLSEAELKPFWEKTISTTIMAFNVVDSHFPEILDGYDDIAIFLKSIGIYPSELELNIYYRIFEIYLTENRKIENPAEMLYSLPCVSIPQIDNADEIDRYRTLERDIETLKRDEIALNIQTSDIVKQLKHLGNPEGIKQGLLVLAYFSIVGIIVPVILLPFPAEKFTPIFKWSVSILFFSGLLFFFGYMFNLVKHLANNPSATDKK